MALRRRIEKLERHRAAAPPLLPPFAEYATREGLDPADPVSMGLYHFAASGLTWVQLVKLADDGAGK